MPSNDLKIISIEEFGQLLYRLNCLPYKEAQVLEQQLKQCYTECLDKWRELETLAAVIRTRWPLKKNDRVADDSITQLISVQVEHCPVEIEQEIVAGEPL